MPSLTDPVVVAGTLSAMTQPRLDAGDGLALRPWEPEDVAVVVEAYQDPAIQQWNLRSMDRVEAAEWIDGWKARWEAETDAGWAIVRRGTEEVVGRISLRQIRLDGGCAEVSYWVLSAARGQGVAVHATTTVCRWAFSRVGLHRIELAHSVVNTASCRVADKAGFVFEGTRRSALLHPDGWHDMHLHGLVAAG